MRTHLSRAVNVNRGLCLKYSNQPLKVRFRSVRMACKLCPLCRRVFVRIVSLNLSRLFLRGQREPRWK